MGRHITQIAARVCGSGRIILRCVRDVYQIGCMVHIYPTAAFGVSRRCMQRSTRDTIAIDDGKTESVNLFTRGSGKG